MFSWIAQMDKFQVGSSKSDGSTVDEEKFTVRETIRKIVLCIAMLLFAICFTSLHLVNPETSTLVVILTIVLSGVGLFLLGALVWFANLYNAVTVLAFSAILGVFFGSVESIMERSYPFIIQSGLLQLAFIIVAIVFIVFILNYLGPFFRASNSRREFIITIVICYSLAGLFIIDVFKNSAEGLGTFSLSLITPTAWVPLAVSCALCVWLLCLTLTTEFCYMENAVENGLAKKYEWVAAFSFISSIILFYVNLIALIALPAVRLFLYISRLFRRKDDIS